MNSLRSVFVVFECESRELVINNEYNFYIDNDRLVYVNLSKSVQSATGLKFLKRALWQWALLYMHFFCVCVVSMVQVCWNGTFQLHCLQSFMHTYPQQKLMACCECDVLVDNLSADHMKLMNGDFWITEVLIKSLCHSLSWKMEAVVLILNYEWSISLRLKATFSI